MSKLKFYYNRIKAGRLKEMILQTEWIYSYARQYRVQMLLYTLLGMVNTVLSLLTGLVSKDLVDIITGHSKGEVAVTFAEMIGLNLLTTILNMIANYASGMISMKVEADIRADIFEKILVTDWESLTRYHSGDLLTRWGSDAGTIASGVLNFIPSLIINIFRFLSAFAMVIYYDWTFAVFAFLGLPVSAALSKTMMKRMVNNNKRSAAMGAKMSGFNQETFSNLQTIKAFDLIRLYVEHLKELQLEYIHMKKDFQRMSIWTSLILTTVGMVVTYSSYGWGIHRVWSGVISYGTMTMFLGLSGTLTGTVHNLTAMVPGVIGLTTSAGRLMDIIEMPREDYEQLEEVKEYYRKNRSQGFSVIAGGVSFAYQNAAPVFENASLEAHPHEVVALVGPSGQGKTTLIRLLLALMKPEQGSCEIIAKSCGEHVTISPSTRQLFAYVPQGNTMFSGTIAENMRNVKPDATDAEIVEALKLACAWEFIEVLPEGIYSKIQERGGGFSEGQSQRLSIARAILRQAPILLLDEATSALDVATERRVLNNLMEDTYPRTVIVTTHRPTVLSACSRVYEIRNRHCVELTADEITQYMHSF